jgi:hypothetical protein
MMNFVRLDRFATHFDRVLIHPEDWNEVRSRHNTIHGRQEIVTKNDAAARDKP